MSTYNKFDDIQAYEVLERSREETMADPKFQLWVKELNISQSYVEPTSRIRANDLNKQYDYSLKSKVSKLFGL